MSEEDASLYTLKQIRVAFSRHLRSGGELTFKDSYADTCGSILVNWDGFLRELEHTKEVDGG